MYRNRGTAVGSSGSGGGTSGTSTLGQTPGLRLTLTSATPITVADVTAATTLYYTPHVHGNIATYDSGTWKLHTSAEVSLALGTLTSGKNYDVFVYYDATNSVLVLELSAAWTTATARANAIARQDGVWVKSSDHSRRLVGTIRTTATTTTEDSAAKRFVSNLYNEVPRPCRNPIETTNSWSVNSSSVFGQANGSATNQFEYVTCDAGRVLDAKVYALAGDGGTIVGFSPGIGIDSTSVNSAVTHGGNTGAANLHPFGAEYLGYPGLGYHVIAWLEASNGAATSYGDANAPTLYQTGLFGKIAA